MSLRPILIALPLFCISISTASAEVVSSAPIGLNKINCLVNSDTIVGVPFRQAGSQKTVTSGTPIDVSGQPDQKEIPLASITLTPSSLGQHYLQFQSGTHDGRWYDIIDNSATSVTIKLYGDSLTGVSADDNDSVVIAEYWTLDTLFPAIDATGDPTTTGHAVVGSNGTGSRSRKTEILYPDLSGYGINRAATSQYYIDLQSDEWKDAFDNSSANDVRLWPDVLFTIRHPSSLSGPTIYTTNGDVETGDMTIPLATITTGPHDNYIAIPRPVDVALVDLNLGGTTAFISSDGTGSRSRKDELLLVDNSIQGTNKAPTKQYYFDSTGAGVWRDSFDNSDATAEVIPAGTGFIIRKSKTVAGDIHFWQQTPSY